MSPQCSVARQQTPVARAQRHDESASEHPSPHLLRDFCHRRASPGTFRPSARTSLASQRTPIASHPSEEAQKSTHDIVLLRPAAPALLLPSLRRTAQSSAPSSHARRIFRRACRASLHHPCFAASVAPSLNSRPEFACGPRTHVQCVPVTEDSPRKPGAPHRHACVNSPEMALFAGHKAREGAGGRQHARMENWPRHPCRAHMERPPLESQDTLAERLRRRPAKPMGSPRVGSNPTGVACPGGRAPHSRHMLYRAARAPRVAPLLRLAPSGVLALAPAAPRTTATPAALATASWQKIGRGFGGAASDQRSCCHLAHKPR